MNQTTPNQSKLATGQAKWVIGAIIAVVVIAVGYSIFKAPNQPVSSEPIKIGVIAPLTGDAAAYGEPLANVLKIAAEEINTAGGINGRFIKLVIEDSKCSGKDAANAMQKLANVDKVKVVIGGFCSSESLAAEPIASAGKIFLFSGGSSSPDLTGKSFYFARNYPSDASQGKVLADIAYNKENWRRVAFIQEQLDYPLGIYKAFSSTFENIGGEMIKEEFPTQTVDFRSSLTKLKGQNPDALFIDTQTPAAAERILKQLQELGWKTKILVSDATSGDPNTVRKNGTVLEGALAAEFSTDPNNPKFQHIIDAYKQKYGAEPPFQSYVQTMYDTVYILNDAIKTVGYDGTKVAEWVRNLKNWEGASGLTNIGSDGDRISGHVAKIIRGGKVELYSKQ